MILSDIDIKDAVYRLIAGSSLPNLISGKVYKDTRPANSELEDISISVLAGDAAQIQEFVLNVNLFVPDIDRGNEHVENTGRLRTLASECISLMEHKIVDRFWFKLESQRIMAVEEADFHFINNRLSVRVCTE